ncbi:hypothetical protein Bca101_007910 [Brassica carinata]
MNTGHDEEPLPSTETRKRTRRSSADDEDEPQKKPIFTRARTEEPILIKLKLEDAKTKSIGMENRRRIRTRGSRARKNRSGDQAVPAKAILKKTSPLGDRNRRSQS